MKSKYVFINEDEVHESMIVHFVMVGTSEREQRKASHVQMCAAENKDVFWSKWDCNICDFFSRLAEQVYPLMSPRDAMQKFTLRNTRSTSLNDVVNNFLPSKNSSLLPTQVTY